ncbi:hypothetical protein [Halosolutus gelatinilyticus]|uniref:hypothetical protein n=1 Tax=Halosolutus gelatinilyticus TaxID=2931975 RepID=UPI001FF4457F|nr:hypothetical protein [Halosolutus gelatinilyticus]
MSAGDRSLERDPFAGGDVEDRQWSRASGYARFLLAKGFCERLHDAVDVLDGGNS